MPSSDQLTSAISAVREAGQIALDYFRRSSLQTSLKSDRSLLSEADGATEQFIIQRLRNDAPEIPLIGEETISERDSEFYNSVLSSKQAWVLDPIDGTNNFVAGNPVWCVSLALLEAGRSTHGIVYFPALNDELYFNEGGNLYVMSGASGDGAVTEEVPAGRLSADAKPLFMVHDGFFRRYDVDIPHVPRISGCTVLNVLYAVIGKAGAASQSAHIWDFAAPLAFARARDVSMVGAFSGRHIETMTTDDFYLDPAEPKRLWKLREQTLIASDSSIEEWRTALKKKVPVS